MCHFTHAENTLIPFPFLRVYFSPSTTTTFNGTTNRNTIHSNATLESTETTNHRRNAGRQEHDHVRVLPRTVRGRNVHDTDPPEDAVLFFQFNCAVCLNFIDGAARLHVAARLGREVDTGWVFAVASCCVSLVDVVYRYPRLCGVRQHLHWHARCVLLITLHIRHDTRPQHTRQDTHVHMHTLFFLFTI